MYDINKLKEKNIEDLDPKELMALVLDIKEKIAKIIDPEAWEDNDDVSTPTEREMWEIRRDLRRCNAHSKATAIIRLLI